jgi:hypothetical protein
MADRSEITIARKLVNYYVEADSFHSKWRDRAAEAGKFYRGGSEQWNSVDVSALDEEGRPHLTLNHIFPVVNTISGLQRQNKSDVVVFPRKNGQQMIARVLTALMKHADDECNGEYEESDVFLDGLIYGKGWEVIDIDYRNDPITGQIVKYRVSPFSVFEDPNCRDYDLNHPEKGANWIVREFWWDKEALILQYPKKVKDITNGGFKTLEGDIRTFEESSSPPTTEPNEPEPAGQVERKKQYRVKEFYWKSYERKIVAISQFDYTDRIVTEEEKAKLEELMREYPGKIKYEFDDRVVEVLHKTVMLGDLVLENIDDPYGGITAFPYFRFCPYFVDGYSMGVVEQLQDPQRELNKRRSQLLHHLNSSANSGWIYEDGSMKPDDEENLKSFGSKPGIHVKYKRGFSKPDKIEPTRMSEAHLAASSLSADDIRKISGINPDLLGEASKRVESGVAMAMRHRAGVLSTEVVFDNFRRTKQLSSSYMIDRIRGTDVYSLEEIKAIVEEEESLNVTLSEIRNWKGGSYGVKVSWGDKSPTTRLANFQVIMEAFQRAPDVIPVELVFEMSDIPNKEKILEHIARQREMITAAHNRENQARTAGAEQAGMPPTGGAQPPGAPGTIPAGPLEGIL